MYKLFWRLHETSHWFTINFSQKTIYSCRCTHVPPKGTCFVSSWYVSSFPTQTKYKFILCVPSILLCLPCSPFAVAENFYMWKPWRYILPSSLTLIRTLNTTLQTFYLSKEVIELTLERQNVPPNYVATEVAHVWKGVENVCFVKVNVILLRRRECVVKKLEKHVVNLNEENLVCNSFESIALSSQQ